MIRVRMHRFSDKLLNATRRAVMMCALVLGCPDGSPTGQLRSRPSIYIRQRNPIHPYLFLYTAVLGALKRRRTMATQPSFSSTLGLITSRLILLRSARRTLSCTAGQGTTHETNGHSARPSLCRLCDRFSSHTRRGRKGFVLALQCAQP